MSTISQIKAIQAKLPSLDKKRYYAAKNKINRLILDEKRKAKLLYYNQWLGQ